MHRTTNPTTKNFVQNINSAKSEKFCSILNSTFLQLKWESCWQISILIIEACYLLFIATVSLYTHDHHHGALLPRVSSILVSCEVSSLMGLRKCRFCILSFSGQGVEAILCNFLHPRQKWKPLLFFFFWV